MRKSLFGKLLILFAVLVAIPISASAQKPMRAGTTALNFLEAGFGGAGAAMGDAYVSVAHDASAAYWNPAGLALMNRSEVMFVNQPWIVGMNMSFASVGVVVPDIGTLGANVIMMDYGEMEVTTPDMQDGTGERFSPKDVAIGLSYGRNLVDWFSFGVTAKLVTSSVRHMSGTALAFDFGAIIKTNFLSPTGEYANGMNIGISIANYGTALKYDGLDLLNPIDVDPDGAGNYGDAPGQFRVQKWELPLIFRIGASITPIATEDHQLTLAANGLHPNNNTESVNLGAEYALNLPTFGKVFFRGGYKALFMEESEYGMAFGFGVQTYKLFNRGLKVEYASRDVGVFGNVNSFGLSLIF